MKSLGGNVISKIKHRIKESFDNANKDKTKQAYSLSAPGMLEINNLSYHSSFYDLLLIWFLGGIFDMLY